MISYEELSRRLVPLSQEKGEWAGLPVPIEGMTLVLEERYPYQDLATVWAKTEPEDKSGWPVVVNQWFSRKLRGEVIVARWPSGKIAYAVLPCHGGTMLINSVMASIVWPLEAEAKAQLKLGEMIPHHAMRSYLLSGCFLETSTRSKVTYVFRKGRPTLALRPTGAKKEMSCIAALCLHPIGYYQDSWAGVMTPTDEVLAHLCLMRGSEEKFWANANQHPAWHPASGL